MTSRRRLKSAWQIRFSVAGERRSISLRASDDVDAWQKHIDHLVAVHGRMAPCTATSVWVAALPEKLRRKLIDVGLVPDDRKPIDSKTIGKLCDEYVSDRESEVKPRTITALKSVVARLKEYFGDGLPVDAVTPSKAREFRDWLQATNRRTKKTQTLATATVRRRIGRCREIFAVAVREDLIRHNPFEGIPANVRANPARSHYVDHATFADVLRCAPNARWRALLVLARYGGLRIPSEVAEMRWIDIAWDANRITVRSPKTAHIEGKSTRVVPLFPEVRTELTNLLLAAEDGAEFVFPSINNDSNLRTTLEKIIARAGRQQWPRLWQNLRASAATDLARNLPGQVAAAICGHSAKIALEHYWQVTDSDLDRAMEIHQKIHIDGQNRATTGNTREAAKPAE